MREAEELNHVREEDRRAGAENGAELEDERQQDKTRFTSRGAIPPVSAEAADERTSPSDLAEHGARLGGSWGGLLDGASNLLGGAFEDAPEAKAANGMFGNFFGGDDKKSAVNPTMQSTTSFKAPGGAKSDRTTVGAGESVDLKGSHAGNWSAGGGTLYGGKNSADAFWRAPRDAGDHTITLDVDGEKVSKTFHVVEPNEMHYKFRASSYILPYRAGAGMKMTMNVSGPADVSFANIEIKEVAHEAESKSGYFVQPGAKEFRGNHTPTAGYTAVLPGNNLLSEDKADMEVGELPKGGYEPGKVVWKIPHNYKTVDGKADKKFADVYQVLEVVDKKGTCRVTKDGQSVTRGIDDDDSTHEQAAPKAKDDAKK